MALQKRGEYWIGTEQADIQQAILKYSADSYLASHFANARCSLCNGIQFTLVYDEYGGCAQRTCVKCDDDHFIGDSEDYADDSEPGIANCICKGEIFEITVGVSLYRESEDVKWFYLGCRCVACGVTGVYADWKNEYIGYQDFLSRV